VVHQVRSVRRGILVDDPDTLVSGSRAEIPLGLLLVTVLIVGFAIRWWLLQRAYLIPDADQTIVPLMARHIEAGEHPVFFWGQPYTGSGDAYILAGLFRLFGEHVLLPHLVPLAAALAWMMLTVILAWRLYGQGVAVLCACFLAFPSNLLINWGTWAGSGYLEMMALGTGAILLALPLPADQGKSHPYRLPIAFLLLGLALWVQPLAAAYILAVLALLCGRILAARREPAHWGSGLGSAIVCATAFVVGMTPLLIFNLQNDWATLAYLTQRGSHLGILTILGRSVVWTGPALLGLAPATTNPPAFSRFLDTHLLLHIFGLVLTGYLLVRCLCKWRQVLGRLRGLTLTEPSGDLALIVLLIVMVLGFLSSSWGAEEWSATQPRYLLPLYTALPLLIRVALPRTVKPAHWVAAGAVMIALCAGTLYVNGMARPRPDFRPLATLLQAHGVRAVYGDYWTVVPLTYLSGERIVGVAVRDDLGNLHNNRYSPFLRSAAATSRFAWVVAAGSARQASVLQCLRQLHAPYLTLAWEDQVIYTQVGRQAFPWWNGGRCSLESVMP
jgi:hypothetical protein